MKIVLPTDARAGEPPPNILFIFTDDLAFDAIGAMGNQQVQTPHIDRLAERGMTMTHAYNMGSWHGAVCMPSRGMLITGRFLWDFQTVDQAMAEEREAGRVWPKYLQRAGYRIYMAGKWHVRDDARAMFDIAGTVRPGMPDVFPNRHPHAYHRPQPDVEDTWDPADPAEGGFWQGGRHWSANLADEAIEFLDRAEQDDRPFFMYISFNAPHDPRQAPQEYLDMYPVDQIELPPNYLPEYPYRDEIGLHNLRDEILGPFPRTEHAVRVHRREYYAIISHMDTQIGRILDRLEETGQTENTWIVFTSDHGLAVGQHGLLGKQNQYDHSGRVPFIVVGPRVPAGERSSEPIYYQDIMPTTLELAGVQPPDHVAYQSLLPVLRGDPDWRSKYPSIYTAYRNLQRAVTQDGWKLIVYPEIGKLRLFHVLEDSHEIHDLAEDPNQAERVKALFRELLRWQEETGDPLDLKQAFGEWLAE